MFDVSKNTLVPITASAVVTASGNGTAVDLRDYIGIAALMLNSTAGNGTAPTLDVKLQDSADGSTGWADISPAVAFVQVTSAAGSSQMIALNCGLRAPLRARCRFRHRHNSKLHPLGEPARPQADHLKLSSGRRRHRTRSTDTCLCSSGVPWSDAVPLRFQSTADFPNMKTIKPLQGEDELLVSDTDPLSSPNSEAEFIRPAYNFCGRELHPYTQGSDIVFRQLCHFNDNGLTKALKFIFVHVKRDDGADMHTDLQTHVIPLAWSTPEEIHVELIAWACANIRSDGDKSEALRLYSEITTAANNAAVEIVGTDEGKKKSATKPSRTRRRS